MPGRSAECAARPDHCGPERLCAAPNQPKDSLPEERYGNKKSITARNKEASWGYLLSTIPGLLD
jgi:hypothetical protein